MGMLDTRGLKEWICQTGKFLFSSNSLCETIKFLTVGVNVYIYQGKSLKMIHVCRMGHLSSSMDGSVEVLYF
jgi:hypothetical protein